MWFRDYKDALNNSQADLVYISLPNSLHYTWAKKALENNYHVIVDKPINLKLKDTLMLVKVAKKKKKLLTEATFFNYHKQFEQSLKILNGKKNIKLINTDFIIPMPKKKTFRMLKKFGGGCISDMSPYAAATVRLLTSGKLLNFTSKVHKDKQGLSTSFSISCKFKNNYYFGYFCFGGEYRNKMTLFSTKKNVEINNVFSPPANKSLRIIIKKKNSIAIKKVKKDDIFENFFYEILRYLKKNRFNTFYENILIDAKFRNKIK